MSEFLLWLGCILGYLMAGVGAARIYYVRAADKEAALREAVGRDYMRYEPDDPECKSVLVLAFWPLAILAYAVCRSYQATILAPTPRQRERAEDERHARELRELDRLNNAVARWQPGGDESYAEWSRRYLAARGITPEGPPAPTSPEEYARLHRPDRVATPEAPTSLDIDAATVFLNDPEFKTQTQSFLDGDEIHP